jgi:hypothetical protein
MDQDANTESEKKISIRDRQNTPTMDLDKSPGSQISSLQTSEYHAQWTEHFASSGTEM